VEAGVFFCSKEDEMDDREVKMFWQLVFAATIAAGSSLQKATQNANHATEAYKERFAAAPTDEDD
jgi:uncharacterized membrane protein